MALYRSHDRGSWIVQRRLLGLPIRHASGCYDRDRAAKVEATLRTLALHGRRDLLEAFVHDQLTGLELLAGVERWGVSFQLTPERAVLLEPAVERWLKRAELAERTKRDYTYYFEILQRGTRRATLGDLPALLARYARRAPPVLFYHVRAACQALVRDTVAKGPHSELWRDVAAVRGPKRRRRQVQGGLTPDAARLVAEQLGRVGPTWWTLCTTGMGPKEYWRFPEEPLSGRWKVLQDRILIHGTKRDHRDRIVPLLSTPVRPIGTAQTLARRLRAIRGELGLPLLSIYTARRTYGHWLERAGITGSQWDALMGHSPKSVGDLYREHDVAPYLAELTAKLRAVIGADPQYVRKLA